MSDENTVRYRKLLDSWGVLDFDEPYGDIDRLQEEELEWEPGDIPTEALREWALNNVKAAQLILFGSITLSLLRDAELSGIKIVAGDGYGLSKTVPWGDIIDEGGDEDEEAALIRAIQSAYQQKRESELEDA